MNIIQYAEQFVRPLPEGMFDLNDYEIHCNFSGGKDSIAEVLVLLHGYKVPKEKIKLVHMRVDGDESKPAVFDWPQTDEYLRYCAKKLDLELIILSGDMGLEERIRERGQWPSSSTQYCTSYLKRDVYSKWVRRQGPGKYLCVSGERAEESPRRANKAVFEIYKSANAPTKERIVHWFRPIHHLLINEVWKLMELANIEPHPCYQYVSRCSCKFCIFLSPTEMAKVAELYPTEFQRLIDMEKEIGHTMKVKTTQKNKVKTTTQIPLEDFINKAKNQPEVLEMLYQLLPCSNY